MKGFISSYNSQVTLHHQGNSGQELKEGGKHLTCSFFLMIYLISFICLTKWGLLPRDVGGLLFF